MSTGEVVAVRSAAPSPCESSMEARTAFRMLEKSDAASTAVAAEPCPDMETRGAVLPADAARRRTTSAPPSSCRSSRSVKGGSGEERDGRR